MLPPSINCEFCCAECTVERDQYGICASFQLDMEKVMNDKYLRKWGKAQMRRRKREYAQLQEKLKDDYTEM